MSGSAERMEGVPGAEKSTGEAMIATEILPKERHKLLRQLRSSVRKFLDERIDKQQLKTATDKVEGQMKRYDSVPVSDLTLKEVERSLRLEYDAYDLEMKNVQPLALPPHLVTTLALIEQAFGRSRPTEARTRWFIDAVTLNAYTTATSNLTNAQPLNVQCERAYSFGPVTLNHKRVVFSGRMDYSVWYGESEGLCLNVLIVEAKGGAKSKDPIPQLLGYMGCIHRGRKNDQKRNCGVYGMAYTGSVWHFLKISHDSKWSEFAVVGRQAALEQPFGLLVWMLRKAATISPAHSKETSAETYSGVGSEEMNMDLNP
ncbi:hypothetical protein DTO006G1_7785 [Penicillium roqueforti]|uniref:Uncharacterized protein n=1 Tax=Penicillium roqueforti (strain FM164) TaxID=1365484 RepID=W6QDJ5_PENRF|nr:uncharacterized protein LCP9604111_8519 [Penicillium roqueforti]CDM27677.1 hypothetical protein PROQFM164_S01g001488 [Penicillium roqueforti FM164]KAF9240979.1 hypothetical protein LCP9604111_8519 [Penicillium roqueforti]KAI1833964.1 hypothetical protein CBS147337_4928 [Penicillium roqueforti]KAI2670471.1 hypothetical protein CBS147355_9196 [Penicillium roqueforti]KAI2688036.1 hypothetical protein LCP963914a_3554 [Penicillium roqueforti]